jgi:hypothetical protein
MAARKEMAQLYDAMQWVSVHLMGKESWHMHEDENCASASGPNEAAYIQALQVYLQCTFRLNGLFAR